MQVKYRVEDDWRKEGDWGGEGGEQEEWGGKTMRNEEEDNYEGVTRR